MGSVFWWNFWMAVALAVMISAAVAVALWMRWAARRTAECNEGQFLKTDWNDPWGSMGEPSDPAQGTRYSQASDANFDSARSSAAANSASVMCPSRAPVRARNDCSIRSMISVRGRPV